MLPLLTEAGGTYTDWAGTPRHDPPQCLSTNGLLKEEVLALLTEFAS
jgi:histidinol-phosphatase